jgi:hypothetical protein
VREVTSEEAQLLSRVLYENFLDKNASFVATSGSFTEGGFLANGDVDWVGNAVSLQVSLRSPSEADISSITTGETVYENYIGFADEQLAAGMSPRPWVQRSFDASTYGIDALALFIVKLAAAAPDNPLLIKQNGAQYVGTETVDGEETIKLKNAGSITYFVGEAGQLLKVTAPVKGFANEITVLFNERGNSTIEVPVEGEYYTEEEVSSFYTTTRPSF